MLSTDVTVLKRRLKKIVFFYYYFKIRKVCLKNNGESNVSNLMLRVK